jgi:PBP1b-binding outer membrane lipoprotein LpoB
MKRTASWIMMFAVLTVLLTGCVNDRTGSRNASATPAGTTTAGTTGTALASSSITPTPTGSIDAAGAQISDLEKLLDGMDEVTESDLVVPEPTAF